jgi:hypothetical protein
MGSLLRRMASELPACPSGQRERQHVVDRLRERY